MVVRVPVPILPSMGVGYDTHQSYPYPLHQSLSDTNEQQVGPLKDWVSVSQTTVS